MTIQPTRCKEEWRALPRIWSTPPSPHRPTPTLLISPGTPDHVVTVPHMEPRAAARQHAWIRNYISLANISPKMDPSINGHRFLVQCFSSDCERATCSEIHFLKCSREMETYGSGAKFDPFSFLIWSAELEGRTLIVTKSYTSFISSIFPVF